MSLEAGALRLKIGKHKEVITLDVTRLMDSDIVLGLPWLEHANPIIDWTQRQLRFRGDSGPTRLRQVDAGGKIEVRAMSTEEMDQLATSPGDNVFIAWSRPSSDEPLHPGSSEKTPEEYGNEFEEMFEEAEVGSALPSHQEWDHEIKIEPGKTPGKKPIYPLSAEKLEALRAYLDENTKKGFIRESQSPAGYPILFVKKKDGSLRLCVDYRELNNITVKNSYPLPLIGELQDRFQGAQLFTKFDIPGAYNQIRIKAGDEWKTAFRTRYGHYEYLVMPFGLTNAPATFQAFINNVLREYLDDFCTVYLDDIVVYSKTLEEHVEHVKRVLRALKAANLKVKRSKTEFHVRRIEFLGFIVTPGSIRMDPQKVKAVQEWPVPRTVKDIQSFLGFANFYRKFIAGYSALAAPLSDLTKKDRTFEWTEAAEKSFQKLKQRFMDEPILAMFDPQKKVVVETDASDLAIGAVLSQPDDRTRLHPIAFHSRKMTGAELNYDVHDKELLAIVESFKIWKVYLEGAKHEVQVFTDHKNLMSFTTTKVLNRRQVRWSEELSSYNFRIQYRKGSENGRADALSRRSDYFQEGKDWTAKAILMLDGQGHIRYNKNNHAIRASREWFSQRKEIAATYRIDDEDMTNQLLKATQEDEFARGIMESIKKNSPTEGFHKQDELLLFQGRVYIPTKLRKQFLELCHSDPMSGHFGRGKALQRLKERYYFPKMRKEMNDFIDQCDLCHRTKHDRHRPYGELAPPSTPDRAWKSIAMDWIVKLPPSKDPINGVEYDSVFVVVERLTGYGTFIPYKEASNAEVLAHTFLKEIVAHHGMPEEIISDRDRLVTSKFWSSLVAQLGVKSKLSSAYHPQTDGKTERLNQTLEQYLRCYVNYKQDNWVQWLPVAMLAYNSSFSEVIGMSPFFANYGFQPEATHAMRKVENIADKALVKASELKDLHRELCEDITFSKVCMAKYYNSRRIRGPILKEGDKAYLLRKNIKTTRPSSKLDYTKLGPFRISKVLGPVNYELDLPTKMRIHPNFHVSLLEPADPDTPVQTNPPGIDPSSRTPEYEVEEILKERLVQGKGRRRHQKEYLIKWKGYDTSENTWEPSSNLNCPELLEDFRRGSVSRG